MITRSYKYRAYPTEAQRAEIDRALFANRHLYNCAIEERATYYSRYKKALSYYDQAAQLPALKKEFPAIFKNIYSQTFQQSLQRLDESFKKFLKEKAGYPRFKSANRFKSIVFPQTHLMGAGGARTLLNGNVKFFGIGEMKIIMHRPFEGRCVQVLLKKDGEKYYVIFVCELEAPKISPIPKNPVISAHDKGLNIFIMQDNGVSYRHPKPWKTAKEKLAHQQRKLSLKQLGSNSRRKAVKSLKKTSEHIANIRNDWQHKVSNQIVKNSNYIIREDLSIKKMIENAAGARRQARKNKVAGLPSNFPKVKPENIHDAAWAAFDQKLDYKAESAGVKVILIDPRNTSKMCSCCGKLQDEQTLNDRIMDCHYCGTIMDRDLNAAFNIKRIGTIQAGILFKFLEQYLFPENFS